MNVIDGARDKGISCRFNLLHDGKHAVTKWKMKVSLYIHNASLFSFKYVLSGTGDVKKELAVTGHWGASRLTASNRRLSGGLQALAE